MESTRKINIVQSFYWDFRSFLFILASFVINKSEGSNIRKYEINGTGEGRRIGGGLLEIF